MQQNDSLADGYLGHLLDPDRPPRAGHPADKDELEQYAHPLEPSRRRDCHFTDIPSPVLLKHLLKGEGGAAE